MAIRIAAGAPRLSTDDAAVAQERRAQLRLAKRAQRERERVAGRTAVQLTLPRELAERLRIAQHMPRFEERLSDALDGWLVEVRNYPALSDLAWNLTDRFLTADDARAVYERNWRHVDQRLLTGHERTLIRRLTGDDLLAG